MLKKTQKLSLVVSSIKNFFEYMERQNQAHNICALSTEIMEDEQAYRIRLSVRFRMADGSIESRIDIVNSVVPFSDFTKGDIEWMINSPYWMLEETGAELLALTTYHLPLTPKLLTP